MTYKHKTHAVDSNGKIGSNADVDFYIDDVCSKFCIIICFMKGLVLTPAWEFIQESLA